ncbi:hypothetical protein P280DRAFT_470117 [Massarina eburnea CBS 473.64]|uniref:Uncharacterized protein n=1 Tax=Massarina eburnea CBS 473.64 TaxID=1395130 RepID=A0A6A6RWP5_9PLEO|nr:hypothetical protein P280DRAFT_470117 [Massarina eburnea CBS 473.64]
MVKVLPLENPVTAEWGRTITHNDYNKMLKGFMPQDMDEKWMIATDTPGAQGNTVVHICRSWTSKEQYALTISAGNPNDTDAKDWGKIVKISWNDKFMGMFISEEEAKKEAVGFCKWLLRCELED